MDTQRVTELLHEASGGDVDGLNRVFPVVYDELRRLAHARLRSEPGGITLNTTALVHEAYLKLVDQTRVEWRNRSHFYAVAARAMRRILIDHARQKSAQKRGGRAVHLRLDEVDDAVAEGRFEELIELDQALERLAGFNPKGAQVVECRFFGGLTYEEIAEVTGTSPVTVRRRWTAARSWLHAALREPVEGKGGSEARTEEDPP